VALQDDHERDVVKKVRHSGRRPGPNNDSPDPRPPELVGHLDLADERGVGAREDEPVAGDSSPLAALCRRRRCQRCSGWPTAGLARSPSSWPAQRSEARKYSLSGAWQERMRCGGSPCSTSRFLLYACSRSRRTAMASGISLSGVPRNAVQDPITSRLHASGGLSGIPDVAYGLCRLSFHGLAHPF
jgi:hypothetical protein